MQIAEPTPTFDPTDRAAWRAWLTENGESAGEGWVVMYKQRAGRGVSYPDAVEEALCFGWVDSHTKGRDELSRYQRFSPRKPKSTWSKSNRERVERLTAEGRMTDAGQAMVDLAKRTGTWDALADAQNGVIPDDLR